MNVFRRLARWAFGGGEIEAVGGAPAFEPAWQAYKRAKAQGRGFCPDGDDDSVRAAVAHFVLLGGELVLQSELEPGCLLFAVVRFGEHLTAIAGDEHGRHAWAVPIQLAPPNPKETPRP